MKNTLLKKIILGIIDSGLVFSIIYVITFCDIYTTFTKKIIYILLVAIWNFTIMFICIRIKEEYALKNNVNKLYKVKKTCTTFFGVSIIFATILFCIFIFTPKYDMTFVFIIVSLLMGIGAIAVLSTVQHLIIVNDSNCDMHNHL